MACDSPFLTYNVFLRLLICGQRSRQSRRSSTRHIEITRRRRRSDIRILRFCDWRLRRLPLNSIMPTNGEKSSHSKRSYHLHFLTCHTRWKGQRPIPVRQPILNDANKILLLMCALNARIGLFRKK